MAPEDVVIESRMDRDRRELMERDARWARERADSTLTDYEAAQLEARLRAELDGKITNAVAAEREHTMACLLELTAQLLQRFDGKIAEAVGELRAEVTVQRSINRDTNVAKLPGFLKRQA